MGNRHGTESKDFYESEQTYLPLKFICTQTETNINPAGKNLKATQITHTEPKHYVYLQSDCSDNFGCPIGNLYSISRIWNYLLPTTKIYCNHHFRRKSQYP